MNATAAHFLRALTLLLLSLPALGCQRAEAARAHAEALWQAAIVRADADPEVQRAAAAARAAGANTPERSEWELLRATKARAALSPGDLELIETNIGPLPNVLPGALPVGGANKKRIAVIPKGTTQVFWKSVEAGVRDAAAREDLDVVWKGPITEDDRAQQIALVQQFTTEGVAGIVLAPLDAKALLAPVRAARAKGIPVVIFDSALAGEAGTDFASFVATDNRAAGRMAGGMLAKLCRSKGKIVMLRYQVGSASTEEREAGFREVVAEQPDMQITVDNRYAGATVGDAKTQALNLADKLREASGVFCCNEMTTHGMLLALQQEGLAGNVRFVGFDASPVLVQGVKDGHVHALIVQNPTRMGREAVQQMAKILRGEDALPRIDTGAAIVDKYGLGKPEIQALLK